MTKEQKEAYAASVKYEAANQELQAIQYHIHTYVKELDYLKGCEATYNKLLKAREDEIRLRNSDKADRLLHLDEQISACSSRIKELQEAISAGQKAAFTTDCVLSKLDNAEAWGTWISSAAVYSAQQPNTATWTMPRAILPNSRWISDTSTQN